MSTRIQIKRGTTNPSGLTTGEFAYNVTNSTLYIGNTADQKWIGGEVTGGVDMGAGSAASQNRVPTQNSVYQYARNNFVHRLNGITGGITLNAGTNITITSSVSGGITIASSDTVGVTAGDAVTWTQLQRFPAGISAHGATLSGTVTAPTQAVGTNNTTVATTAFVQSEIIADTVTSVNGATGAITNVARTNAGNTFSVVQVFDAGISAAGGITLSGSLTGATATFSRLVTGNAGFSGALTGTATNASALGGTAAASWALLASPTFTGTPAAPTPAIGTNTTQIATTAFVQNEIIADTVTSVNGVTGAITNVARTNLENSFSVLQTFTAGISAAGGVTLASPNLTGTPTSTTAAVGTNSTQIATTAFVQNEIVADTVTSIDGVTGAITNVARTNLGNTFSVVQVFNAGISAAGGITFNGPITGATATFNRRVNALQGVCVGSGFNVSTPQVITNTIIPLTASGGATLTVGSPGDGGPTRFAIEYNDGVNPVTYGTFVASSVLTASRNYTLPNDSGTLALTNQLMGTVNGSTAATTAVTSFNGRTGAVDGASLGANTFSGLQTFTTGISAAGGITLNGPITGVTATFSRLVTGNAGFSGALTGAVTGNASTATALQTARGFSLSGDVTAPSINFDGTGSVTLNTAIAAGVIVDADINAAANIAVTKLAANKISGITLGNNLNTLTIGTGLGGGSYNGSSAVTITNNGVQSFNGSTGAIQGVSSIVAGTNISITPIGGTGAVTVNVTGAVTTNTSNTFTAVQIFTAGLSASGGVTLASPNMVGTPTAPTAAVGTNTTQIATTAFVQNEIVADTVTSIDGVTGAITNVARTNLGNTFSVVQVFNAGISAAGGITFNGIVNGATATFSRLVTGNAGFSGALTGAVTGNASTATALQTARGFSLSGDVTASVVNFDGTSSVTLSTAIASGVIVNDDINASAGIVDTKLATISTAGKVSNSATTATNANTASAIVARDASGNFSAGTITASLTGTASNASSLGNTAAASWALLASPTFTGTPAAPTPAIGTNTTQIATTAFVQNEIIADTVTSIDGVTGAITNVARKNTDNAFSALQTFTTGISAAGGITFNGNFNGATATFSRLVTGNAGFSGALTGTATNASALGGVAAASYAQLASPAFTGTPTSTTAAVGTNTTQIATTAFVQNEIVADTVTSFNGSTGAIQGVGSIVAGTNVTISPTGGTGAVTINSVGVTSTAAYTWSAAQTFNGGVTASTLDVTGLAKFNGNVTVGDNAADVLTVTSGATFGITDHSGAARFASTITATGVLTANGGVTASAIDVTGLAKFNGNVTIGDAATDVLTVTSGATFGITDHSGVARFAAGVTASRIDVINDLKVVGGTEINGHVTINRGLTIGGGGGVLNALGGISGVTFTQTTDTTGVARFNGGATASALNVTGVSRLNGGVTASAMNVTGVSRLNGGVTASTLDVSGTSRFAETASFPATVGLSAGVAQVTTIQSNNIGQVKVGIPVGVLIAGTTQAGLQFLSDDGLGGNYSTTFQTTTLSANRTITLPDDSGTLALTKGTVWRLNGITGGITLNQGANITITSSVAGGITIASTASGGGGVTTADPYTWSALQSFSAGISAAGVTTSFLRPNGTNGITVYGANFSLEDVGYHVVKTTVMGATTVNVNQPTIATYNHNIANNCTLTIGNTAGTARVSIDQTGSPTIYLTAPVVQVVGELEMGGLTLDAPRLRSYREVTSAPTISAGTLTLNLSDANFFNVALNANITTLSISSTPASANTSTGFTLVFTADGTARSVTWGGSILWASGNPPTLTSTNGKRDVFSFITTDGGTNWLGFVGGQNY